MKICSATLAIKQMQIKTILSFYHTPIRMSIIKKTRIWWTYYILIYVNGKMRLVETIPGMGKGGIKKNDGGGEFNCAIV
jgi:hypothetical protein